MLGKPIQVGLCHWVRRRQDGLEQATGWPWRVITISSPSRARSISCESLFLASATLWLLILKI
jgi:hypothetical protein